MYSLLVYSIFLTLVGFQILFSAKFCQSFTYQPKGVYFKVTMATKGDSDDIEQMIEKIRLNSSYRVLSMDEYKRLVTPSTPSPVPNVVTSTPGPLTPLQALRLRMPWSDPRAWGRPSNVQSFQPPIKTSKSFDGNPMRPLKSEVPRPDLSMYNEDYTYNKPNLPYFSGDTPPIKGDTTFNVWSFEVRCLMKDNCSPSVLFQAIRRSLRGTARETLVSLGDDATVDDVLTKLNVFFGNVATDESLLTRFYSERQKEGESVVAWGCRLEKLLQQAISLGYVVHSARNEKLRCRFWKGLLSEELKMSTKNKFDNIQNFELLVQEVRAEEQELGEKCKLKGKKVQHQPIQNFSSELSELSKNMSELLDRMSRMESRFEKLESDKRSATSADHSFNSNRGSFRGGRRPFKGNFRHGNATERNWQRSSEQKTPHQPKE